MSDPRQVLEQGVAEKLHPGAQLFVSLRGEVIFDWACGEARTGVAMTPASIVQWFSSGKPITSIAVAQLFEKGLIRIDAPVADYLPKFSAAGKHAITLEHLLTHTGGFRAADKLNADLSWEEIVNRICE